MNKEFYHHQCACLSQEDLGGHDRTRERDAFYIAHPDHPPCKYPSDDLDEDTFEEMEAMYDEYMKNRIKYTITEEWDGIRCPYHDDGMLISPIFVVSNRIKFGEIQKAWEFVREKFGKYPGFSWEGDERDDDWKREQAMQAGMAHGCQGYNDVMGY